MTPLEKQFAPAISFLTTEAPFRVDLAIILGSGLGDFAQKLHIEKSLPTNEIPDYPANTVPGHSGKVHFAKWAGKNILLFQGRIHRYEGYSLRQCLLPVELSFHLGARKLIITNAAGGINANFSAGDLMLVTGFNSLFLQKELSRIISIGNPERRNSLTTINNSEIYLALKEAGILEMSDLKQGSYFYTIGPNYETAAEIKFIRTTGADAVGMSSVHEAIYAIHLGMAFGMISVISNLAAGISPNKLSHAEVTETAEMVKPKFSRLLLRAIELLK